MESREPGFFVNPASMVPEETEISRAHAREAGSEIGTGNALVVDLKKRRGFGTEGQCAILVEIQVSYENFDERIARLTLSGATWK